MRIGDKIRCNVSAIFGCIWTIACKSFLYIFVEFVSSSRLSDSYYGNVRYSWNTFLGLILEIKVNLCNHMSRLESGNIHDLNVYIRFISPWELFRARMEN